MPMSGYTARTIPENPAQRQQKGARAQPRLHRRRALPHRKRAALFYSRFPFCTLFRVGSSAAAWFLPLHCVGSSAAALFCTLRAPFFCGRFPFCATAPFFCSPFRIGTAPDLPSVIFSRVGTAPLFSLFMPFLPVLCAASFRRPRQGIKGRKQGGEHGADTGDGRRALAARRQKGHLFPRRARPRHRAQRSGDAKADERRRGDAAAPARPFPARVAGEGCGEEAVHGGVQAYARQRGEGVLRRRGVKPAGISPARAANTAAMTGTSAAERAATPRIPLRATKNMAGRAHRAATGRA